MAGRGASPVFLCASKGILFFLGLGAGFVLDLVPSWVMNRWKIPFCAESCPTWLSGFSLLVYAAIPLVLAVSAAVSYDPSARAVRPKPLLIALAVMTSILIAASWITYAYEARII